MLGTTLQTLISMTPCKLLCICEKTDTSLIPLPRNIPNILAPELAAHVLHRHTVSLLFNTRIVALLFWVKKGNWESRQIWHTVTLNTRAHVHAYLFYAEKTAGEDASLMFSVSVRRRYISAVWPSFQS